MCGHLALVDSRVRDVNQSAGEGDQSREINESRLLVDSTGQAARLSIPAPKRAIRIESASA